MESLNYILEWVWTNPVVSSLFVGVTIIAYFSYVTSTEKITISRPNEARKVGKVSRLLLYPLKSAKPMKEGESLLVDSMGVRTSDGMGIRDRTWMVTLESGTMMSLRAEPSLVLIQPSMSPHGDFLLLDAPGMATLQISTKLNQHNSPTLDVNVIGLHSQAVNCGKEAAEWICTYLGKKGFLIVYHPPTMPGSKTKDGPYRLHKAFDDNDRKGFADGSPLLLMTEGSVNDVKKRVPMAANVSIRNFRPNIYIAGPKPYEEDEYDEVYIGENIVLKRRLLAIRCHGTAVDPETGKRITNKEPLTTLHSYRPKINKDPCLGLYMGVIQGGEVHVGDTVYAVRKKYNTKEVDSLEGEVWDGFEE